jgi:hypothetical protein
VREADLRRTVLDSSSDEDEIPDLETPPNESQPAPTEETSDAAPAPEEEPVIPAQESTHDALDALD